MRQIRDQSLAGTCAKGTLWGLTRTGGLVFGAVLASILLVDLPRPTGGAAAAPAYVPAGEAWIEPGAGSRVDDASVKVAAADPVGKPGPATAPKSGYKSGRKWGHKSGRSAEAKRLPR